MKPTIWKYQLFPGTNYVNVPRSGRILDIQTQQETITMWILIFDNNDLVDRKFQVYGTGWEISDDMSSLDYIGTALQFAGSLVWHVFEETDEEEGY